MNTKYYFENIDGPKVLSNIELALALPAGVVMVAKGRGASGPKTYFIFYSGGKKFTLILDRQLITGKSFDLNSIIKYANALTAKAIAGTIKQAEWQV